MPPEYQKTGKWLRFFFLFIPTVKIANFSDKGSKEIAVEISRQSVFFRKVRQNSWFLISGFERFVLLDTNVQNSN